MKSIQKQNGKRPANLKLIADQAGVSMMTVSRTLRGRSGVAVNTAEKIHKLARDMGYRPNKLVEGLRTGRSSIVAVVMPSSLDFYENALREIESSLDAKGCALILNLISRDFGRDAMREEIRRLERCLEFRVDGIILRPVNDDANAIYFNEVLNRGVPLVVLDRKLPDFDSDFVGTDNIAGGAAAAARLVAKGCGNLLVMHAGDKISTSRERRDGFKAAAHKAGVKVTELDCGGFNPSHDFLNLYFAQKASRDIDGVFAVGDHLGRAALRAIRASGLSCPGHVKLIGFGNLAHNDPDASRLATFDQHPHLMGSEAVKLLMERLENPKKPYQSVHIPIQFIEGETA